jgi:hypothetical protein
MKDGMDRIILAGAGSVFVGGLLLTCLSFWFQHNLSKKDNQPQAIASSVNLAVGPSVPPLVVVSNKQADSRSASTGSESPQGVTNPSPNYIRKILSQTPEDSKTTVANSFVGKHISWDATTEFESDDKRVLFASFGLNHDFAAIQMIAIPLEPPKDNSLLQFPIKWPIHVEGTIASFDADNTTVLKDVVVTRLPYSSKGSPFGEHQ